MENYSKDECYYIMRKWSDEEIRMHSPLTPEDIKDIQDFIERVNNPNITEEFLEATKKIRMK